MIVYLCGQYIRVITFANSKVNLCCLPQGVESGWPTDQVTMGQAFFSSPCPISL